MTAKIDRRWAAAAIVAVVAVYFGLAYVLAPFFWRHFERQPELASFEATTRTALGLPGDAINVGLEGAEDDVLCAMHAAGWRPADTRPLGSPCRERSRAISAPGRCTAGTGCSCASGAVGR